MLGKLIAGHGRLLFNIAGELMHEHDQVAGVTIPVAHVGDLEHVLVANVFKLLDNLHGQLNVEVNARRSQGIVSGDDYLEGVCRSS